MAVIAGKVRLTPNGRAAADLTISDGRAEAKYVVYLRGKVVLQSISADRGRAELAARLLGLMGVDAEAKGIRGGNLWYVTAYTDKLAAGREELRRAVAGIIGEALARGWADAEKARRWLEKLERGRTVRRGWPKYNVGLVEGALEIRHRSTSRGSIEREVRRLGEMGLKEGVHFTAKMPEGGRAGYILIPKDGLMYAAWLSAHGSGEQRRLAAEFVEYILERAKEKGEEVYKKALEIARRGGWQAP